MADSTLKTVNIKKQEKRIDRTSDIYKFARDFTIAGITFTFILNPILAIPMVLMAKRFHNKYKEHADDNKNLYGKSLIPIGTGHGDYETGKGSTGIYMGIDEFGLPIHLSDKELTTHGIIFGATGAGKTTTIFNIMRQHMARGGGFIFIDGKSENPTWANVFDMAMETNREDEIFLLSFRAAEESKSNSWNFLLTGSSTQVGEMLSELALPSDAGANQIFVDRGKQLLYSMLSVASYFRDIKKQIITFQDLINMLKPDCLLAILKPSFEEAENNEASKPYARYWIPEDYVEAGMSTSAKQMVRNFAENIGVSPDGEVPEQQMKLFKDQHSFAAMQFGPTFNDLANTYGKIFNTAVSDIDISDIIANNRILYVLLPSLEKSAASLQGLGKMVLSAVKQACASTLGNKTEGYRNSQMAKEARKKRARPPFLVIADEYGSYAIKGFSDVLAQARSLGVGVIISIQEKASLEKAGKEESIRILGNTVWKMFLKIEDPETIDFGMKRGGKIDIATQNSQSFDKNAPIDHLMKTDENYSISNVNILKEQDFTEPSNGAGVFLIAEEVRKFQGPWYEPDRASAVWLNRLYPTIRMKISDDNNTKKSKLMENDVFDE